MSLFQKINKLFRPSKKSFVTVLFFLVGLSFFLVSRMWVLQHSPKDYSDVEHDYVRYAKLWRDGYTPYRIHLFEYPPAAIPLLALPLELEDRKFGLFTPIYRKQIFVIETILFSVLLFTLAKLPVPLIQKIFGAGGYILAGMWAKDFWYEGLDLVFFGTFGVMACVMYLLDQRRLSARTLTWVLFWTTVALKLVTLPLALPLLLLTRLSWKKELFALFLGFAVIWGPPGLMYRSSLSVFVIFHAQRPMKWGALGTYVGDMINLYKKTDYHTSSAPDFALIGPIADKVTKVVNITFALAMLTVIAHSAKKAITLRQHARTRLADFSAILQIALMFMFAFFLTGKTFSSPFHIWYVPLLAIYPFPRIRDQLEIFSMAALMLGLDTTPYIKVLNVPIFGPIKLTDIRNGFRFVPMLPSLLYFALAQPRKKN